MACGTFIIHKSLNKYNTNFNKLNLELYVELNTLGVIQRRLWNVVIDLLPRTLQTLIALKSKKLVTSKL